MPTSELSDADLRRILTEARVIAVVGHSDRPDRPSYQIAAFLRQAGYTVYPVNATVSHIDGEVSYPNLQAVPEPVDIVNVFRRSRHLSAIVDDAIAVKAGVVWAQSGISDENAAQKAVAAGLEIVMDRCIRTEYARLISR
jgi:uncharacterized protein